MTAERRPRPPSNTRHPPRRGKGVSCYELPADRAFISEKNEHSRKMCCCHSRCYITSTRDHGTHPGVVGFHARISDRSVPFAAHMLCVFKNLGTGNEPKKGWRKTDKHPQMQMRKTSERHSRGRYFALGIITFYANFLSRIFFKPPIDRRYRSRHRSFLSKRD